MLPEDYRDPALPTAARVEDLLARMTLPEKVAQLCAVWLTLDPDSGEVAPSQFDMGQGARRDPLETMAHGIGQITRPLGSRPVEPAAGAAAVNELQRRLVEGTRLGIPAICHEECLTGLMAQGATSFPSPLSYAATWDTELVEAVGEVIRRQMRAVGVHQGLAPVADVARDARWGRVEETLGEDPYLVGEMVCAYVRGLQGDDPARGIIATLKHFVAYSASEGGRNFAPAHVGPRELADVYLVPFEMAVKDAGARSVMNAYQEIDGEPPAASRWLLTEVLRERWGFEGFVVADYGAITFLHLLHHVADASASASAQALRAGLDVELPGADEYLDGLPAALAEGLVDEADIDRAVRRVLRAKFDAGIFESPYVDVDRVDLDRPDERALAGEVARRSLTLIRNDGTLPLAEQGTVAVLGPNADDVMALFGNYSYENHLVSTHFPEARHTFTAPTVLEALRERFGAERIVHARGCDVMDPDRSGIEGAVRAAEDADVAVVVVGDRAGHFQKGTVGEGTDATDLALPGVQGDLVEAVLDTGTPTVVVLLHGRPFALGRIATDAAAVLAAWFPGQEGATAIAEVLAGDRSPEGRSPVTFARTAGAMPVSYLHKALAPGLPRQREVDPIVPFGHGLTYTSFEHVELETPSVVPVDGTLEASCTVRNVGARDGVEVVQLYVRDDLASITRPTKELKAFARVALAPGASARVRFEVPVDLLSFTGRDLRRLVEPGTFTVMVGASSADIRLEGQVVVEGEPRVVGEDRALRSRSFVEPSPVSSGSPPSS